MKQFFSGSLRINFTFLILVVVVLPMLGTALLVSVPLARMMHRNAEQGLHDQAQIMVESVSHWDKSVVMSLHNLSAQPDIISLDPVHQKAVLQAMITSYEGLHQAAITDLNGLELVRSDEEPLKNYIDLPWFQGAAAGADITRQVVLSRTTGKPAVYFSTPVRNDQGKIIAVAVVSSDVHDLSDHIGALTSGETGFTYVVNELGQVVAHPDPAYTVTRRDLSDYPPVKNVRLQREGQFPFTDEEGVRWLSYILPINNGWGIVLQQQEREVLSQVRSFWSLVGWLLLSMLILIGTITWFVTGRLVQPIVELTQAATTLADGQLKQAVTSDRRDELGILSRAFNRMATQLRTSLANLEQRVDDRTTELARVNQQLQTDITKREQIETALRKSRELLEESQRMAKLGWWRWDIIANTIEWSPQVFELYQVSPDTEIDFELYLSFIHPDDHEKLTSAVQNLLSSNESDYRIEVRVIRQNGELLYTSAQGKLTRAPDGQPLELLGVIQDITARKLHELEREQLLAEVQATQNTLNAVLNAMPTPVFFKDTTGRYLGCNQTFIETIVGPDNTWQGKTIFDLIPDQNLARQYHELDQALLANPGTQIYESSARTFDGEIHNYIVHKATFHGSDGHLAGLVVVMLDITDRKAMEQDLVRAKEAAETANQIKSQFLSTMTHELRTPMNGVLGMTNLLLDTPLNQEQLDLVNTIHSSGDTLLTLINDVLDFSKIEAGKLELEQIHFDIRRSIEETLDLIALRAAAKGLNLAYYIEPDVPACLVQDVTRLRQILTNLLSNAVKFTDHGEILLTVRAAALATDQVKLTFVVKDSGIGIPADRLDRLFQSFSQIDASTTRRFGGSGLGLAISKRLSELLGGQMWVESEVGVGSTFYFSLIATIAPNMTAEFQPDLSVLKGRTVLLASENQTNQGLLAHYLTDWQVNIIKIEGLQLNSQSGIQPDVIIIDLRLVHDAAQRRLQAWQRSYPETPIIALLPLGKRLGEAKRYQTLTTVPKPIRPAALYQALATIIDGQTRIDQKLRPSPQFDTDLGRRHPLRILMAEDNLVNQKVAQGILKKLGYRADIAANGLEVLEALDRQPYDVILMDVNMPEMDGVTATKKIRHERAAGEQPHIISMTANAMEGDREQYLAAGMNDYISKPIRLEELIKALLKVTPLSKQHATDEPGNH